MRTFLSTSFRLAAAGVLAVTLQACGGGGGGSGSGSSSSGGTATGQVQLASGSYIAQPASGTVVVSVERTGSSTDAASATYSTVNGTAVAGTDFTAVSGTVSWAAGDTSARNVAIPINASSAGNRAFSVQLASPSGASLGTPSIAAVAIAASSQTAIAIRVSGNHLVDASGNTVQLRGVNVSGLEGVAVMGWDPSNPWGGQTGDATPNWNTMKTWGVNAVRLPLNEASWLGLSCVDGGGITTTVTNGVKVSNPAGTTVHADPGGNYQATVANSVAGATAASLYVILDLHLAAPGSACPTMQNAMADADHSVAFWTSLANAFKGYPNVIFELFNEPFLDQAPLVDKTPWADLLSGGGTLSSYRTQTRSSPYYIDISYTWKNAGIQQMLDAVRATGATNVVLASSLAFSSAIDGWLQYKPTDPANQLGAVWHAYPAIGYPTQASCIGLPSCSARILAAAQNIMSAGYPVVITEFGDVIGGSTAPWASNLLPFADTNGIGYLAWAWDKWAGMSANVLITDAAGTPTAGYGTYVKTHYLCRAAGTTSCP